MTLGNNTNAFFYRFSEAKLAVVPLGEWVVINGVIEYCNINAFFYFFRFLDAKLAVSFFGYICVG